MPQRADDAEREHRQHEQRADRQDVRAARSTATEIVRPASSAMNAEHRDEDGVPHRRYGAGVVAAFVRASSRIDQQAESEAADVREVRDAAALAGRVVVEDAEHDLLSEPQADDGHRRQLDEREEQDDEDQRDHRARG